MIGNVATKCEDVPGGGVRHPGTAGVLEARVPGEYWRYSHGGGLRSYRIFATVGGDYILAYSAGQPVEGPDLYGTLLAAMIAADDDTGTVVPPMRERCHECVRCFDPRLTVMIDNSCPACRAYRYRTGQ